jgi:hypothetical protein
VIDAESKTMASIQEKWLAKLEKTIGDPEQKERLQLGSILRLIERMRAGDCAKIEAAPDTARAFMDALVEAAKKTIWVTGCSTWCLDERGVPATWPWTMKRFKNEMAKPDFGDFELIP